MDKELKIKIYDLEKMKQHVTGLGASFVKEIKIKDTYFNQPKGEVLKLSETSEGNYLAHLKAKSGGFAYLQNDKIHDAKEMKRSLGQRFGIKSVLMKKRRSYRFKDYLLDINIIQNVGNFLVVSGPSVSKKTVRSVLKIKKPLYITVPFDELPKKK